MKNSLLLRRRAMVEDKPWLQYGIELEAIESTGTQWIDTGVAVSGDLTFDGEFIFKNKNVFIFGARESYKRKSFCLFSGIVAYGDNTYVNVRTPLYARIKVTMTPTSFTYSDSIDESTNTVKYDSENFSTSNNFYLFAIPNDARVATGVFYNSKLSRGEDVLRDLIPFQLHTGEVGMWDKVTNRFFANQGTGELIPHYKQ